MASGLDLADHVVDRTEHREHDPAEHAAHDQGQQRFDQLLHLLHRLADVTVVEVADVEQRFVEGAGVLADAQHADHQRREEAGAVEGGGDVLPLDDQLLDPLQPLANDQIADDPLRRPDRLEDRYSRSVEQRKGVGEACQDDLAQNAAEHRHAQLDAVEAQPRQRVVVQQQSHAEEGEQRQRRQQIPVGHQQVRHQEEDLRLQRQHLPHALHEHPELRHHVDHQEQGGGDDDRADEGRVGGHLPRLRHQFILPLQRFVQAVQHVRQAAGRLAGTDETDEDLVEDAAMALHRLRQGLPALDRLDQAGDHLTETRMLETVAQVGQTFENRHAGTDELLQMETEVDQFAPRHATTAQQAAIAERLATDEVELHAPQSQIEIDEVDRVDAAEDHPSLGTHRLVRVQGHGPTSGR